MELSLNSLGSQEIQEQVLKDIEDLMKTCKLEGLLPIHLSVGKVFVEIACAQTVRNDFKIKDWSVSITEKLSSLTRFYNEARKVTYEVCENNNCIFDKNDHITVFFDPEEDYICLYVANIRKKTKDPKAIKTKQGYEVEKLAFEKEDILLDFDLLKLYH